MGERSNIKSVAIIGAGAAGAVTAAAFKAEGIFDRIRVFERRELAGGTWIYDPDITSVPKLRPGLLPPVLDSRLEIPAELPQTRAPSTQERYSKTPVYENLTTNVPDIAMSFSDARFAYGPFVPHHIPRQYVENYFSIHGTDKFLVLNTTVEDLSRKTISSPDGGESWRLTLRRYDGLRQVDIWWEETFDAVVLCNGHYSVPWVPEVTGLEAYLEDFPGRVIHSKYYRSPLLFAGKRVLIIGNSTSGHDISTELIPHVQHPLYQSRRSKSRWDGDETPDGVEWNSVIKEYQSDGRIIFEDDTFLDDIDAVIYCTGYRVSFQFWNTKANGRPLWDYDSNKLIKGYWHTFLQDFPTVTIIGLPRVLTFTSFEYQAIALARLWAGRNSIPLPSLAEQQAWESEREEQSRTNGTKFHEIRWDTGETKEWLQKFFDMAGLGTWSGQGRIPPALSKDVIWAIDNIKKYPEKGIAKEKDQNEPSGRSDGDWVLVDRAQKDLLAYI